MFLLDKPLWKYSIELKEKVKYFSEEKNKYFLKINIKTNYQNQNKSKEKRVK